VARVFSLIAVLVGVVPSPGDVVEPRLGLDLLEELVPARHRVGALVAPGAVALASSSACIASRMSPHGLGARRERDAELVAAGAALGERLALGHVAGADLQAQRHALALPLEVLGAGLHVVAVVDPHPDARGLEVGVQLVDRPPSGGPCRRPCQTGMITTWTGATCGGQDEARRRRCGS
jgi:hypothetical protein